MDVRKHTPTLFTEDEARTKICWAGRARIWAPETDLHRATIVSADQHCAGSACMAWEPWEPDSDGKPRGRCKFIPE